MTLQPLLPLLLPTKIAIIVASAAIIPKAKIVGLSTVELPVSPFNPMASLFARSVKKLRGLPAPPVPIWSPNAKVSIIAAIVPIVLRAVRAAVSL